MVALGVDLRRTPHFRIRLHHARVVRNASVDEREDAAVPGANAARAHSAAHGRGGRSVAQANDGVVQAVKISKRCEAFVGLEVSIIRIKIIGRGVPRRGRRSIRRIIRTIRMREGNITHAAGEGAIVRAVAPVPRDNVAHIVHLRRAPQRLVVHGSASVVGDASIFEREDAAVSGACARFQNCDARRVPDSVVNMVIVVIVVREIR
mmetsp:Transcript_41360/g.114010  ORF Transcript_41360/g.114010 Transcript_41360/m.114010 type:complete len:206 (-) Transcript_41360:1457-2074(-)